MKYSRNRMLESFEQWEKEMEGNLNRMEHYHAMSDRDLEELHKEVFDAMYEEDHEKI